MARGSPPLDVVLLNRQRRRRVDGARLRRVLGGAARALRVSGEVAVVVTADRAMRTLNARYRHKDRATDVLSFPGDGEAGLGDIVISAETAERNARRPGAARIPPRAGVRSRDRRRDHGAT